MKKYLLTILAVLIIAGSVSAGTYNDVVIDSALLDADPIAATSDTLYVQDNQKTAFFVDYDETQVGGVSAVITAQVSYDNTNWLAASFYDYAGGATLQTSETLTADGWYYFWLNPDLTIPYARIIATCTGCDTDDNVEVSVYQSAIK